LCTRPASNRMWGVRGGREYPPLTHIQSNALWFLFLLFIYLRFAEAASFDKKELCRSDTGRKKERETSLVRSCIIEFSAREIRADFFRIKWGFSPGGWVSGGGVATSHNCTLARSNIHYLPCLSYLHLSALCQTCACTPLCINNASLHITLCSAPLGSSDSASPLLPVAILC
jgi:hypothetical protein